MDVKVAVVTGANKGLGFELAKGLCKNTKWTVYLTSRDETRGLEACKQMENLSNKPKYHQLDITDSGSIEKFYNHMKSTYRYVDLLINNAGILFLKDSNETKLYQAEQTMFVNFFSLINFTEKMLPIVKNGGKIINVSSSSGHLSRIPSSKLRAIMLDSIDKDVDNLLELMSKYTEAVKGLRETEDGWGESPYVISKVGVNAYTQILHRKLKDRGIKVSSVHPGYIKTDMTRGSGTVTAEEGAEAPLHLALNSEESGVFLWSNKTVVPWDGPDPRRYIDGRDC